MMEEDYTPELIDGRLGMPIGHHIYFPGWEPDLLHTAVKDLAKAIHNARNETLSGSPVELSQGMADINKAPALRPTRPWRSPPGPCGRTLSGRRSLRKEKA
jgi:hypothetical protein